MGGIGLRVGWVGLGRLLDGYLQDEGHFGERVIVHAYTAHITCCFEKETDYHGLGISSASERGLCFHG